MHELSVNKKRITSESILEMFFLSQGSLAGKSVSLCLLSFTQSSKLVKTFFKDFLQDQDRKTYIFP